MKRSGGGRTGREKEDGREDYGEGKEGGNKEDESEELGGKEGK